MQAGAYYRTSDHINNFKVKVKLWRASSNLPIITSFDPSAENVENKTSAKLHTSQELDEYTFSWQEKIFSLKEIEHYEVPQDYTIPIEIKYHEDVLKVKKNLSSYPKYLYSYVEADSNRPLQTSSEKPTTSDFVHPLLELREARAARMKSHPNTHASYSASRIRPFGDGEFGSTLRHRGRVVEFVPTDEFKNRRSHVLGTFQTMYIMADISSSKEEKLTEKKPDIVESADTANNDANKENKAEKKVVDEKSSQSSSEIMLCAIRYDSSSGLLIVKPDFNSNRKPYEVTATVHSDSFQYKILHCSAQMTAQDLERDRQTVSLIDAQRANLLRASVGPDFEIPFRDVFRLVVVGEILSASDFEYDSLYVMHSWDLPPMWSLAPRCPSGGVTQRCARSLIDGRYVAYFSSPLELDSFYQCSSDNTQAILRFPSLLVHVASIDTWNRLRTEGYGFIDMPMKAGIHELEITCWRPVGRSMFDEMRRFFVGSSPEIEDLSYVRVPSSFQGNRLSKLGFRVQSTGTVRVRVHVMQQVGEAGGASADLLHQLTGRSQTGFIPESQMAARLNQQGGLSGLSALSHAVQSVIDNYHRAKEKLTAAREGLPSHLRALLMLSAGENRSAQQQNAFASAAQAVISSRMAATNRFIAEKSLRQGKKD